LTSDKLHFGTLQGVWKCKGVESGTAFDEVDLDEGEWADYDEKVSSSPLVYSLLSQYKHAKHISGISSGGSNRDRVPMDARLRHDIRLSP
jgi:hypothetical protein